MALSNQAILAAISRDRALGSELLFKHRHPQASPPFHIQIMDVWGARDEKVVVEAFREGAKSTLSEEFILMEAGFQNFHYLVIIGETHDKACQRLEAIKYEATTNMKILNIFGKMKGSVWNENCIVLSNGAMIEARGWDQEFRGFKHLSFRPDRVYLDDVENKMTVRNTAAVDASMKKIYMEILPAMDTIKGKIRVTGTPLADDCVINRLKSNPEWMHVSFPICDRDIDDPNAQSLWPERYPMEWIRKKKAEYMAAGMLREFNQEYMLIAATTQGKPFDESMFQYSEFGPTFWMPKKILMDPARTTNTKSSDETGYCVVSKMGSRLYVWESGAEFLKPDQIVSKGFELSKKHDEAQWCVEKASLDEWLLQPIRAESLRRGEPVDMVALTPPQDMDKQNFILSLQPFVAAGDVILIGGRVKHQKLVSQLINFPSGKKDVLNSLAYATRVFSGVAVYTEFSSVNIIESSEPDKKDVLCLGFMEAAHDIVAVLMAVSGQRQIVLNDWVSALTAEDAVYDVLKMIRIMYPSHALRVYVPADLLDQQIRVPLIAALRKNKMDIQKAGYCSVSRGCLSSLIRTELHGNRLLLVDRRAKHTANALLSGYCYPVKNGAQLGNEPEKGISRSIGEALEAMTFTISAMNQVQGLPSDLNVGTNAQGINYPTALPRRR